MGHAAMKKLEGIVAMGGEVPFFDPTKLVIVGLDEPKTAENWFAHCSRLDDVVDASLQDYVDEILATGRIDNIGKAVRDGANRLILLDGRRTARAGRLAREVQAKKRVPETERVLMRVEIVRGDPEALYRINLDSHKHEPLTRTQHARAVLTYYQQVGEDVKKAAAFFRVSEPTIRVQLRHFDLSTKVQKAIDGGEVPATITKKIADLPRAEQDRVLEEMKVAGATRGRAAMSAVENASKGEKVNGERGPRMRSRTFIEKWRDEVKKKGGEMELVKVLGFILGGPLPDELKSGKHLECLEAAGFKVKE